MQNKKLIPIAIGFFNFFGLGLGSFLLKLWKRGLPSLIIALVLLAAALMTQRILFVILLIIWLLLIAWDGWNQARQLNIEEGLLADRPWLPFALGAVFIVAYIFGVFSYLNAAQAELDDGMAAYLSADCTSAVQHFNQVSGFFKIANHENNLIAAEKVEECDYLITGKEYLDEGDYHKAIISIDAYLTAYPTSPITDHMIDQATGIYLQWAADLRASKEYEQAIDTYSNLTGSYPDSSAASTVPEEIAATQIEWGDEFHANQDFDTAVETYQIVLDSEPKQSTVSQVEEKIGAVYLDFAASLRIEDSFDLAIGKYQLVLDEYSETSAAQTAEEEIPNTYLQWGNHLLEGEENSDALAKFGIVIEDYPDSAAAEEALSAMVQAYLGQGQDLADQGRFNASIEAYESISEITQDADILAQADAGIAATLALLALDTGTEGQLLMQNALRLACDNEPAASPAVNTIGEDEPGKYLMCKGITDNFTLSDSLEAQYPGEFRFAIKVTVSTIDLDSARYGPTGALILTRRRVDWTVSVIEVATGEVWVNKTFTGASPPSFPRSHRFSSNPDYLYGSSPNINEILSWLEGIN